MAGTSTKTKPVAARVPVDLAEWMETQGKAGDVIVQALTALRAGGVINSREAELEAKVASLTTERDQWIKVAKTAMPTSNAEGRRLARAQDPMGRSAHQSGPLLASAVPEVSGMCNPNFRPGTVEKASKTGR